MTHTVTRHPFTTGAIVRIGQAASALLRIDSIAFNHTGPGQHRYYGEHYDGTSRAVSHAQCQPASSMDMTIWATTRVGLLARSA